MSCRAQRDWATCRSLAGAPNDVEDQLGNEIAFAEHRREARTTLECIIENVPEGELRASFVALPEVKRVPSL
jgi:hypothetical protein